MLKRQLGGDLSFLFLAFLFFKAVYQMLFCDPLQISFKKLSAGRTLDLLSLFRRAWLIKWCRLLGLSSLFEMIKVKIINLFNFDFRYLLLYLQRLLGFHCFNKRILLLDLSQFFGNIVSLIYRWFEIKFLFFNFYVRIQSFTFLFILQKLLKWLWFSRPSRIIRDKWFIQLIFCFFLS